MDYEVIQNYVPSSINVAGTLNCLRGDTAYNYTYTAPSPPNSYINSYTPHHSVSTVYDSDKSRSNFGLIRKLGFIKMTDYSATTMTTDNYLARIPKFSASLGWPHCNDWSDTGGQVESIASWDEVIKLEDLLESKELYPTNDFPDPSDCIKSVMANVVSDSYQALDALTTYAEIGESLSLIKDCIMIATRPLQSFARLKRRLMKRNKFSLEKLNQVLTDSWLQYRYAIMPEISTIEDSVKLLANKGFVFKTSRELTQLRPYSISLPSSLPDRYITSTKSGTLYIRATGKARFGNPSQRMFDQITFNPVQTAWELIPYSFVVDWFINVGDVISARSLELADFSSERKFCYSVKRDIITEYHYHRAEEVYNFEKIYDPLHIVRATRTVPAMKILLRTERETSYDRRLFRPSDVKFQFKPSLNWKRWLDAYSLSLKPLTRALRKIL